MEENDAAVDKDYLQEFLEDVENDADYSAKLLKIRSGPAPLRKSTAKDLSLSKDAKSVIQSTLSMLYEPMEEIEQSRLENFLVRILRVQPRLGSVSPLVQVAPDLINYVRRMKDRSGDELLANIAQLIGLKMFLTILRPSFSQIADLSKNASFLAICAQTFGLPIIVPFIRTLVKDVNHVVCQLGLVVIQNIPTYVTLWLPSLPELVLCCSVPVTETALSNAANSALTSLADHAAPRGFSAFEPVLPSLWSGARKRKGRPMMAYLRSLAAIAATAGDRSREIADPVLAVVTSFSFGDENAQALAISSRCAPFVEEKSVVSLLNKIFENFMHTYVERVSITALNTTSDLPIDASLTVKAVVDANVLVNDDPRMRDLALRLVARVLKNKVHIVLDRRTERRFVDSLLSALPNGDDHEDEGIVEVGDTSKADTAKEEARKERISVHAVVNAMHSLGKVDAHPQLMTALLERDKHPSPVVRENALRILGGIVDLLNVTQLRHVLPLLYEELGEQYPEALAEVIASLNGVLNALFKHEDPASFEPSIGEIITRVSPILRNRNEKVQDYCIKLMRSLAEHAGEAVPAREWMHVCFELLELQKSHRQSIRFDATAAFAAISVVIGPTYVVSTLVSHLKSSDRQFRITTAAAIASVAAETGPFTILPVLMQEYSEGDTVVQHGVLKTLAFMFEFADNCSPYVAPLVTLLDDALLTSNQVHRQTAASIIRSMAEASIGAGLEATFIHFLNELLPSIFETSPHVIDRVLEAINAIRKVVGVSVFVMYLWPGLFHPARKVRNVYWEMWNAMYKDGAVPMYPVDVPSPWRDCDVRDEFI